jgi:ATP-dependent Zn protease
LTGAVDGPSKATGIARAMATRYRMVTEMGQVTEKTPMTYKMLISPEAAA